MVEQAFTMANLASASVKTEPIDANAAWLLQQLFNIEGSAAKTMVELALDPGQPNNKQERTGIRVFEEEKTGDLDDLDKNEVVIFCDTSRLERRVKDPLHLYDNKVKRAVGSTNGCGRAFMYTQTFANHWDVIQVCPWFLQYAMGKKFQTKKDITSLRAYLAVKGLDTWITNKKYTPIDLMSLWDKAMLHEMMHTTPGGFKDDIGGFDGYGWKNCKGLAGDGSGKNNADSWALFGSALYWFSQGSPIDENGNFVSTPSVQGSSRRWLGSGAGRGIDAVQVDAIKHLM
ncbi:hypothetical protein F4820DRAFT_14861 [Hypoxylon rubiginosum]|uniref:Uncharacterized protein n=1 Tax=Hypoxylon rubiginosum TaxID=110542 RepID=A0ACB9YU57_9PEZI|nr:hypothetical protein F4820DRAFT_14861 [Hypoxylon rubiginosum]